MTNAPNRTTADLSSYPDLVVIYLGMRVNSPKGLPRTGLAKFAPATPARGSLFSARRRLGLREGNEPPPGVPEEELYQR